MDRYYPVDMSIPAGTLQSAPLSLDVVTADALLVDVEIIIPRGHKGLTGIRVLQSSQQILPWGNLFWLVADGYTRVFDVDSEVGANSLSLQAYNEDFFDHLFQVRFHIRDMFGELGDRESALSSAATRIMGLTS
jgi:hypothetical protein